MAVMNGFGVFVAGCVLGAFVGWGLASSAAANRERRVESRAFDKGWFDGCQEGTKRTRAEAQADAYLIGISQGVQMERQRMRDEHPSSGEPLEP